LGRHLPLIADEDTTMTLLPNAYIPFTDDLTICHILNGMWQVSGGHGRIDPAQAVDDMMAYHDAGYTTWDLADHYGPAEEFIGAFRRRLSAERGPMALETMQAFTKWVPRPGPMPRRVVEAAVDVSRRRMDTDTLDLLQFHWWDYRDPAYLEALSHLADLRDEGKLRHVALTNFDTERLRRITAAGIRVVSNQVQYSLIDQRPASRMVPTCLEQDVSLLTYGTLCGGLLSDRYLNQPEPGPAALPTASLRKYKQMIDAWGGWALFQALLRALDGIARRHGVSIANVAVRAVLDRPAVAGVITGARLGVAEHRDDNARVFALALTDEDRAEIAAVTDRSRDLLAVIGDCGDEYR
jgi:aryl-alcohol dehydrogenase-like predicted oxidoreductase